MANTTARNKDQVDQMSTRDRLWDSLNYSYGKKREDSEKQYRKAYSQADNQLLGRGMQRSSYGAQTLANLDKERVDASNDIWDTQIADYENRLQDLENQEWQRGYQERQFAESQRQFNENLGYQKERAGVQDTQWQQQFGENQRQFNANFDWQKERAGVQDTQWQQQFGENQRQFNVNFDWQKERAGVQDQQWEKAFDQTNTQNDRQLAASYVQAIIANGADPTDDLLARAGLSRADANAMKAQMGGGGGDGGYSGGGGGSGSNNKNNKTNLNNGGGNDEETKPTDGGMDAILRGPGILSVIGGKIRDAENKRKTSSSK